MIAIGVHSAAEIEDPVTKFAAEANGALIIAPHAVTLVNRNVIIELAARYRLPAVYGFRIFATSGGLLSYGTNPRDQFRRGASYVDRVLKGEKPGDLPVQNPIEYQLVTNLKTAKALGLDVPHFSSSAPMSCSNKMRMSAFGTKQTSQLCRSMSAFGGKADITRTCTNVCF